MQNALGEILWSANENIKHDSNINRFMEQLATDYGAKVSDYESLHRWSIIYPHQFWSAVWKFTGVVCSKPFDKEFEPMGKMQNTRWFPGAGLNFAENLLRHRDNHPALIFWGEDKVRREISHLELYQQVHSLAQSFRNMGLKSGDRVGAFIPNIPEAIIAMLAATSIGATWSSCSPDFGAPGVVDRFGQIEPTILICADGYFFKGEKINSVPRIAEILKQIPSIRHTVVVPYTNQAPDIAPLKNSRLFGELIGRASGDFDFEQLPADHPLYVMFSSGTTGKPKCIVHRAGGVLINQLKELQINLGLSRCDRFFYQTTCGWMMWNWLVTGLASGATLLLYDGAPFHHDGNILFELAEREGMTIFGTNAKYLAEVEKRGIKPGTSHDLSKVRAVLSTGSPLIPESFDFVYQHFKSDVQLSSISGGTDIVGLFGDGSVLVPVRRGEIQCRSLGMDVQVFNEQGRPVVEEKGELICAAPFPSMPLGFWNDPDGSRYSAAYFERFPGVWAHGDYVELTKHGGLVMFGRSDTVLNPGGIRIGTAEIYRQVEQLPEILESIVIGQNWNNDVRVVLFVKLQPGAVLDADLKQRIAAQIRKNTTAFHVPKKIVQVSDIPRTRSGKIVELAVKNIVEGMPVKNIEALANPEALELYKNLAELQE